MSLIWTLIDVFLFAEISLVLLMVLPIFSPQKWQRFFKSKFLASLAKQAQMYVYILIGLLILCLLEALREMVKYSSQAREEDVHLDMEMKHSMHLFRAQRNFYISGFAAFLVLVIKRLVSLISAQAFLLAQSEASMKQAQSATARARALIDVQPVERSTEASEDKKSDEANLMAQSEASLKQAQSASAAVKSLMTDKNTEKADEATEDATLGEITKLKEKVHELTSDLNREKKDKEALKSQAESLNREYDRLTEEYSKLQKKITIGATEGGKGSHKDD